MGSGVSCAVAAIPSSSPTNHNQSHPNPKVHPLKSSPSFFQRLSPQQLSSSPQHDPLENPHLLRLLSSYCPHSVLKLLGNKTLTEPVSITITGACLLADICGFTKFSGDLCQEGVNGLDKLRITTSSFLTKFIEIIYFYYGDVMAFAGDALICVFAPRPEDQNDPSQCCLRAVHCGNELKLLQTSTLSAHIAIDYGKGRLALIGGYDNIWTHIFDGVCFACLGNCINEAGYQELVISSALAKELENCSDEETKNLTFKRLSSGNYLIGSLTSSTMPSSTSSVVPYPSSASSPPPTATTAAAIALSSAYGSADGDHDNDNEGHDKKHEEEEEEEVVIDDLLDEKLMKTLMIEKLQAEAFQSMTSSMNTKQLKSFIPSPILGSHHNSLHSSGPSSYAIDYFNSTYSELRRVTCLFLKFDSYYFGYPLEKIQTFFSSCQEIILNKSCDGHGHGHGYIRQVVIDDKGCVLIALWGVPTASHVNNSISALNATALISKYSHDHHFSVSMGLTTGEVYCGRIGSKLRCDYAAVGSSINFSARLMAKAKGKIYLDETTNYDLVSSTTSTSPSCCSVKLPLMTFKGKAEPVQIYQFLDEQYLRSQPLTPTAAGSVMNTARGRAGRGGGGQSPTPVEVITGARSTVVADTSGGYPPPSSFTFEDHSLPLRASLSVTGLSPTLAPAPSSFLGVETMTKLRKAISHLMNWRGAIYLLSDEDDEEGGGGGGMFEGNHYLPNPSLTMMDDNCIQVIHVSGTTGTGKTEVANQMLHLCSLENNNTAAAAAAASTIATSAATGTGNGIGTRVSVGTGVGGVVKTILLSLTELDMTNEYFVIRQIVQRILGDHLSQNIKQQKQILTSLFYETFAPPSSSHHHHRHQQQDQQQSLKQKFHCLKQILDLNWSPPELAINTRASSARFLWSSLRSKFIGSGGSGGGRGRRETSSSYEQTNEVEEDWEEDSIEIFAQFFVTLLQNIHLFGPSPSRSSPLRLSSEPASCGASSLVIILDESQFCDSASWSIIFHLLIHLKAPIIFLFTLTEPKKHADDGFLTTDSSDDHNNNSNSSKKGNNTNATAVVPFLNSQLSSNLTTDRKRKFSENAITSMDPLGDGTSSSSPVAIQITQRMKFLESLRYYSKVTIIKLSGLSKRQVRSLLQNSLRRENISMRLVNIVTEICEGNVYWCKVIIEFIIQYGEDSFCNTFCSNNFLSSSPPAAAGPADAVSPPAAAGPADATTPTGARDSDVLTKRSQGQAQSRRSLIVSDELLSMSQDYDDCHENSLPASASSSFSMKPPVTPTSFAAPSSDTGPGGSSGGGDDTGGLRDEENHTTAANSILYRLVTTLLDRLSFQEKEILKYASVCGAKFPQDLLRLVLPPILSDQCDAILSILQRYKFITPCNKGQRQHRVATSSGPISNYYTFISYRMRDIIYSLIPCSDAATIHYLVGKQMEILYGGGTTSGSGTAGGRTTTRSRHREIEAFYEAITFHYTMASLSQFQLSKEEFFTHQDLTHTSTGTGTRTTHQLVPPLTSDGKKKNSPKSSSSPSSISVFLSTMMSPSHSSPSPSGEGGTSHTSLQRRIQTTSTGTAGAAARGQVLQEEEEGAAAAAGGGVDGGEEEDQDENGMGDPGDLRRAFTYSSYLQTVHEKVKRKSYEYSYLSCKLLYRLEEYTKAMNYLKYAAQEEAFELLGDGYRQGMIRFLTNWLTKAAGDQGTTGGGMSQRVAGGAGGRSLRLPGSNRYSMASSADNGLMETYATVSNLLRFLQQQQQ